MLSQEPASATTTPHESHPSADQPTSDDVEAQAGGTLGGDASLDPLAAVANTARATLTPEAMLQRTRGLRLRTLTVNGFKSFADKTEFAFNESVVGIVGPNGCGKSNVVDAIKWVLGERSSKSLRGKEMIDVIFAGSAGRKPSGMAGVTLAFDNPLHSGAHQDALAAAASEQVGDGRGDEHAEAAAEAAAIVRPGAVHRPLPVDTDVVEVERRLYRDGKSQYLINGKLARLKDIRELFLDTGIGADAYSIIEQGKVDAMLLASPTERRAIFEEAAGIAKYRLRRVEAERKLDRTEGNLVRTREQLASTERRLRIVRGQAAKARRYTEIKDEHDALRLALAFEQYDDLRKRLEGLTSQLGSLEARRRETAGLLREAEEAAQEGELRLHELSDERRRLEQERTEGAHRRERAQQRREMALRAIEEAAQQASSEAERLHDAGERITALDSEVEQLSLALEALRTRHEASERELDEATAARAEAMGSISERRAALDRARRDTAQIER
ncbi:MAG: AAA family ATPase, partial [Planctomycetota bacterium]